MMRRVMHSYLAQALINNNKKKLKKHKKWLLQK